MNFTSSVVNVCCNEINWIILKLLGVFWAQFIPIIEPKALIVNRRQIGASQAHNWWTWGLLHCWICIVKWDVSSLVCFDLLVEFKLKLHACMCEILKPIASKGKIVRTHLRDLVAIYWTTGICTSIWSSMAHVITFTIELSIITMCYA